MNKWQIICPVTVMFIAVLVFGFIAVRGQHRGPAVLMGDNPSWISIDETRRAGMLLLTNRYPEARVVSVLGEGQIWTLRFITNDVVSPLSVIVDRKTGEASFKATSQ